MQENEEEKCKKHKNAKKRKFQREKNLEKQGCKSF